MLSAPERDSCRSAAVYKRQISLTHIHIKKMWQKKQCCGLQG